MGHGLVEHPLTNWRKSKGLTLDAAAALVGTTRQVWWGWEKRRNRPSAPFMQRICDVTHGALSANDFFPRIDQAA